jgi:hypothetical protein
MGPERKSAYAFVQRRRARDLINAAQLEVILQVLAHTGRVVHERNMQGLETGAVADA